MSELNPDGGGQTRRQFLARSSVLAGASVAAALDLSRSARAAEATPPKPPARIRTGSCVVGLEQARQAGLDGVEIRVGDPADTLRIAEPAVRQQYRDQMGSTGLVISSFRSTRQNVEILERIGHDSVRVYYDVGNSNSRGYDVPEEIRFLNDRIACFHFKDRDRYLGEGSIQFEPVAAAIQAIGYAGWIVMETANPSKDAVADAKRNGTYIRRLFGRG